MGQRPKLQVRLGTLSPPPQPTLKGLHARRISEDSIYMPPSILLKEVDVRRLYLFVDAHASKTDWLWINNPIRKSSTSSRGAIESGTRDKGSDPSRDKDSAETDDSRFHRGSDPLSRVSLSIAPSSSDFLTFTYFGSMLGRVKDQQKVGTQCSTCGRF